MPSIDHTKILRVCMINTQHMFHLYGDNIDMHTAIANLKTLGAQMFVPISPNINWCNCSNWIQTKQIFQEISPHNHLLATSSDIGKEKDYFITSLVGGSAILTFGLWSSKVCSFESDESGYGTYTITTLQGKSNLKKIFVHCCIYCSQKRL
jgi:hypothetical protein